MKKTRYVLLILLSTILISCGKQESSEVDIKGEKEFQFSSGTETEQDTSDLPKTDFQENETLNETLEETTVAAGDLSYQDLSGYTFHMFSVPETGSPIETLTFNEDGTFEGNYSYLYTNVAEGEEEQTIYYCDYRGEVEDLKKINEYTYMLPLIEVELIDQGAPDSIGDGVTYVYSSVYDFEDIKRLYLYLPGAPYSALPQSFKYRISISEGEDTLRCYGLFNALSQYAWVSENVPAEQMVSVTEQLLTKEVAMQEIQVCEEEEQEILEAANSEFATQMMMNMVSGRDYELWDMELNRIWNSLKYILDEEEMNALRADQRIWVKEKENAIEAAGKEWEGGSGEPMARAAAGAEYTKQRVYELVKYLK